MSGYFCGQHPASLDGLHLASPNLVCHFEHSEKSCAQWEKISRYRSK
jgi:hypothetical protein